MSLSEATWTGEVECVLLSFLLAGICDTFWLDSRGFLKLRRFNSLATGAEFFFVTVRAAASSLHFFLQFSIKKFA